MKKIYFILPILVLGLAAYFPSQQGKAEENEQLSSDTLAVRSLVQKYCEAEFHGATLGTKSYKKSGLDKFIIHEKGHAAPGWDTVTLIRKFNIISVKVAPRHAMVSVEYNLLGEVDTLEVRINQKIEKYNFRLIKKNGEWKLIEPYNLRPHISIDTAINHIQSLYDTQGDVQPKAPEVIRKLRELKSSRGD